MARLAGQCGTIWETYMGWFKAEATSELYPTQPRDLYSDIVALTGIKAVVELGRDQTRVRGPGRCQYAGGDRSGT